MDASELMQSVGGLAPEPYVRTMARLAGDNPDVVAIVHRDRSISRSELEERSNRLARVMAERGLRFGEYAVIGLPNGIDFYVAFFAILKVGAVPLPLSARLPRVERQGIVDLAQPGILVGVEASDHPGIPCLPEGFEPDEAVSADVLPERVSPAWKAPTSGGSTGRPKIIRSGGGAEGYPIFNQYFFGYTSEDVQAVVAPLYHNSALAMSVGGLLLGQRLVVLDKFDAEATLMTIERHRITWLMLVPTMMHRMYRLIEQGGTYDLSSIRLLWHTASRCPEWLKEAWIQLIGPEKVMELYGGTEALAIASLNGSEWLQHRGSVGRPTIGDMKILDDNGEELPAGVVGEIYMKGMAGMPRTYEYVGATPKERDGWETLGDLGWKDEDGYLYIADRRVDMIVSGGANIYPAEVENAIDQHPSVFSSVVVGLDDPDLVERVHAIVHAEPGTAQKDILDFLADKLVRYKVPRSIEFTDQPLRDDSGKVRRSQLRQAANERFVPHV